MIPKQKRKGERVIVQITNHAKERIGKRCGIPKKAFERSVQKAFDKGLRREECVKELRKYLDYLFLSHKNGNNIKVYGNHAYIFCDTRLITVLTLPNKYRKLLVDAKKRR